MFLLLKATPNKWGFGLNLKDICRRHLFSFISCNDWFSHIDDLEVNMQVYL